MNDYGKSNKMDNFLMLSFYSHLFENVVIAVKWYWDSLKIFKDGILFFKNLKLKIKVMISGKCSILS